MSLARTALRIAAVEALAPSGVTRSDAYPTIARGRVFDSRMDMIDDLAVAERAPVAVVYTEADDGTSRDPRGAPPYQRVVDLVIELSIVAFAEDEARPGTFEPAIPVTDAEAEAALDLLEAGVRFALMLGPGGRLFRSLTGSKVRSITSTPARTSEEAIRLAMRTLTLRCEIPDDCFDWTMTTAPTGTARLPEPLRSVVEQLAATTYGAKIAAGLAAFAPIPPLVTPLSRVDLNLDVATPNGVTDGTPDVAASATIPQD